MWIWYLSKKIKRKKVQNLFEGHCILWRYPLFLQVGRNLSWNGNSVENQDLILKKNQDIKFSFFYFFLLEQCCWEAGKHVCLYVSLHLQKINHWWTVLKVLLYIYKCVFQCSFYCSTKYHLLKSKNDCS